MKKRIHSKTLRMNAGDIKPADYNPRRISDAKLAALGCAMREFGDLGGLVLNVRTGNLVSGHQRLKHLDAKWPVTKRPAKDKTGTVALGTIKTPWGTIGYREVDWPDKKERMANLAANQHGGEFDMDLLTDILRGLDESDRLLAGFEMPDLKELGIKLNGETNPTVDAKPKFDKADELQKKWGTQLNQLWRLGEHRLLCGDALSTDNWNHLGGPFDFCFADPSYEMDIEIGRLRAATKGDLMLMANDKMLQRQPSDGFRGFFVYTFDWHHSAPWITCPDRHHTLIGHWNFGAPEKRLFKGLSSHLHVEKNQDQSEVHEQTKPTCLLSWLLPFFVEENEQFADAFAGGGATIMVAEQLKRKARAIEICPKACAVILQRFADAIGPEGIELL